jgi:hypothetical protein
MAFSVGLGGIDRSGITRRPDDENSEEEENAGSRFKNISYLRMSRKDDL